MLAMRGRPMGRLFYLLLSIVLTTAVSHSAPVMTRIVDTVFRADGTAASGTLLISWPAFVTASGQSVAAGTKSVALGSGGALQVDLAATADASPAGTYYTVVFQLDGGTVKTQYWAVGTSSPTTLAAVQTSPGTGATTSQLASKQYVDSVVSTKANDTLVVHRSGGETIDGVKQFAAAPSVPTPAGLSDAANKEYVDSAISAKASDAVVVHKSGAETIEGSKQFAVAPSVPTPVLGNDAANRAYVDTAVINAGSGSYLQKTGDTMSGPLVLSGDPTAPNQASTRNYVDNGLAGKASLTGGVVPVNQLGSGSANSTTCLKGNSSWGACGTSANAVSIQGVAVDATAPTDGQVITYEGASGSYKPKAGGGTGLTAGMQAIKYATDFSWSQSPNSDLSVPGTRTISLSACPAGVSGSEPEYWVYIAGTGTAEAAKVTGGSCAGDGKPGTLNVTTANTH